MTHILSTLKTSGRAAIVAITLGAATLGGAAPAMAQPSPSFNFEFGIQGGGSNFAYGFEKGRKFKRECLTNSEVRRGLQRMGWDNVRFVDSRGVRVKVVADWGRRSYAMNINKCTGRVTNVERLRRQWTPGFRFQFNF